MNEDDKLTLVPSAILVAGARVLIDMVEVGPYTAISVAEAMFLAMSHPAQLISDEIHLLRIAETRNSPHKPGYDKSKT